MRRYRPTIAASLALAGLVLAGVLSADAQQTQPDNVTGCIFNSSLPTLSNSQRTTLQCDTNGKLITTTSGGSGGTSSTFGAAFPATGTAIGVKSGANMVNLTADGSNNLNVDLATALPAGSAIIGALVANQSVNEAQVNGVTILTGAGAVGTGSERVAVGQDTTTIAGSAPGTAGTASANVVTVQGIASMTKLLVTPDALPANQTVNVAQVGGTNTLSGGTAGSLGVGGLAASGATASGNPVKTGGVFNTTQPTVTNGQAVDEQMTARGAQIVATGVDTFNATINAALPAGGNTIGAVTQASGPWTSNVTQFGGNNVNTGTGAGGTGTPRVTVSNDSITAVIAGSASSSAVLKASAGKLYGVSAECTAACWLMVFNATSAPGNGATTAGVASGNLQDCIPINANSAGAITYSPERPENFSVGITAMVSSTTCATLTASAVAFIKGFAE